MEGGGRYDPASESGRRDRCDFGVRGEWGECARGEFGAMDWDSSSSSARTSGSSESVVIEG